MAEDLIYRVIELQFEYTCIQKYVSLAMYIAALDKLIFK